jgi:hypothetical protein
MYVIIISNKINPIFDPIKKQKRREAKKKILLNFSFGNLQTSSSSSRGNYFNFKKLFYKI